MDTDGEPGGSNPGLSACIRGLKTALQETLFFLAGEPGADVGVEGVDDVAGGEMRLGEGLFEASADDFLEFEPAGAIGDGSETAGFHGLHVAERGGRRMLVEKKLAVSLATASGDDVAGFDGNFGSGIGDVEPDELAGEIGVLRAARNAERDAEVRGGAAGGALGHASNVPLEFSIEPDELTRAASPEKESDAPIAKHFRFALIEHGAARNGPAVLMHAAPVFESLIREGRVDDHASGLPWIIEAARAEGGEEERLRRERADEFGG